MGLARTRSIALAGVDAHLVDVEVDIAPGVPEFTLTALSDRVLGQARHRVRAAVVNSGAQWQQRRIVVSLTPATVPKAGSRFDLAIAAALLLAGEQLPADELGGWVLIGELDLGGGVRGVTGVLPSVIGAYRHGARRFVVPRANLGEARLVGGADIVGVGSLAEFCGWVRGEGLASVATDDQAHVAAPAPPPPDFRDVVGQSAARHAMEVAAAGGHHVLMLGAPGVGKTMLAERLPSILPDLGDDEALEVTALHSIAGRLPPGMPLISRPPFCAPHHTATVASIVGGGAGIAMPGAVSLANRGVLFLDEAPQFSSLVLDALRQPVEAGSVTIARSGGVVTYAARFQLVMAANPCPCAVGGRDTTAAACICAAVVARNYQAKLSGPFRDRLDLKIDMAPVSRAVLAAVTVEEDSAAIRARVMAARDRSRARLAGTPWLVNGEVPGPVLRREWPVAPGASRPLYAAVDRGVLSTRGVDRVLKVSWTLADLAGRDRPGLDDVRAALALRLGAGAAVLAASA